jgi:hypothetical protein
VVGTGVNTKLLPKSCKEGWLRVYAMKEGGRVLEFMHKVSPPPERQELMNRPRLMMSRFAWLGSRVTCLLVSANLYDFTRWVKRRC